MGEKMMRFIGDTGVANEQCEIYNSVAISATADAYPLVSGLPALYPFAWEAGADWFACC